MIDHLIFGTSELESGCQYIEELLGVRPVFGGRHLSFGTHNALLGLGPGIYLEVIAPDPERQNIGEPLWMGLDQLDQDRLIRWAAKSDQLEDRCRRSLAGGVDLGAVFPGSRETPSGHTLHWQLTDPRKEIAEGILPFFIDWGHSQHPADQLPQAGTLLQFWATHPAPETIQPMLKATDLELDIRPGALPRLYAEIQTAKGIVQLGSGEA